MANVEIRNRQHWKNFIENVELKDVDQNGKDSEESPKDKQNMDKLQGFLPLYVIVQIVGLTIIAFIFYWSLIYNGGFGFFTNVLFNWHPFLTFVGLNYLPANVHAGFNGVGFFLGLLGGIVILVKRMKRNMANFYSIHSWIGLLTMGLFMIQSAIGFTAFMFPILNERVKVTLLPYHVFFEHVIFLVGIVASISGIHEIAIFKLKDNRKTKEEMESVTPVEKLDNFLPLLIIAEVVGFLSIVFMFYWCISYAGGLGFSAMPLFQWHPLLMSIGLIFLMGNGILVFRILRNTHKYTLKLLHAAINASALVLTLLAALAVLVFHNQLNIPNFYSIHSWIGCTTILIFIFQACISIFSFLLNGVSDNFKATLLPYHVYFGHCIFVLGICSAISGINAKAIFQLRDKYQKFDAEGLILNITGVLFVIFGAVVVYMTTNIYFKRYPRSEDNVLLERNRD
ncbi:hypothetical protein PGB90_000444 [Kerria lacca]